MDDVVEARDASLSSKQVLPQRSVAGDSVANFLKQSTNLSSFQAYKEILVTNFLCSSAFDLVYPHRAAVITGG